MLGLQDTTALLLAGGRGLRMGGVDKGLQPFQGQALAQHVLQRLAGQGPPGLHGVVINANRNPETYRALGEASFSQDQVQLIPDQDEAFAGPLAGIQAGLAVCPTALMLVVPCDSPWIPLDMAQRLLLALQLEHADVASVLAPEVQAGGAVQMRSQPVFCLMRTLVAPSLQQFLASGGRKVQAWMDQLRTVHVPFDAAGDDPRAFANANTLEDLRQLEGP
jgi:molybdopterin-guanine dinucleotide biosynthesis protein A